MDGLKTQLHPDRLDAADFPEKIQHFRPQAVRSGGDGEGADIRVSGGLKEKLAQPGDRPVGVGVGLKVGDIAVPMEFPGGLLLSGFNLLRDGQAPVRGEIAGASPAAEDTAPIPQSAVPVRAGQACVQRDLVKLFPKSLFDMVIQAVVAPAAPIYRFFH